jgi:hypothetical protein
MNVIKLAASKKNATTPMPTEPDKWTSFPVFFQSPQLLTALGIRNITAKRKVPICTKLCIALMVSKLILTPILQIADLKK